jgi:hypothetical protein
MTCDTRLKPRQTILERKSEVQQAVRTLDRLIAARRIQVRVGPKGGIAFQGWIDSDRDGVTDACAYRRIMATGSALAKAEIAKAEQLAGRSVDRQALAHGHHSHDGGRTWHDGH